MDIDALVNAYGSYIYNYALKLSCDPHLAEDLAQETFIKAWKNADQLLNSSALKAWLRKICLNTFLMQVRKEKTLTEISYEAVPMLESDGALLHTASSEPTPEDEVIVAEAVRELQSGCFYAMARKLSLHQRITFSLVDMFGLSVDEVSEILNLSKSAVKGLLYRARMNLDSFFSGHCSLIHAANPCRCEAWITFAAQKSLRRDDIAQSRQEAFLDYTTSNYIFDASVRGKVYALYKNMPEKTPNSDWYSGVTQLIKQSYLSKEI